MSFKLLKQSQKSKARRGQLKTRRGIIETPFFMPIATKASVKALTYEDLEQLEAKIVLSNTYHLMLKPGNKLIKKAGGLHQFMNWSKPILTDSGGFQVFSLNKIRKITEDGVEFRSHIDGSKRFMRPEDSIQIQLDLGSDIIMALDECVELPAKKDYLEKSVELTTRWAERCKNYFEKKTLQQPQGDKAKLFGIVQGGLDKKLRIKSVHDLKTIGFDGYAIGGLSVGESEKEMYKTLDYITAELPEDKPRYLMGVGRPENIINAVKRGVDMFDCVIPTREARHGRLYLWSDATVRSPQPDIFNTPRSSYKQINIKAEKWSQDFSPINIDSRFPVLKKYSKAYLRHLFSLGEPLSIRLATLNNLEFYLDLMKKIRKSI
ncbi:tRNA guanosine(34) transglycosylase Tgt [Candidatus Falkowbacteria bacterium RIFOXYA2_FULL_35_8]|uniref:Queuine tRNA-ribosyltransferase n=1 Tax=Candidatus Falkowbacteria bacterium RIFOXYC2_FULL_36_12 TaxID=1798002 RepID=A0A1F5SZ26_9BACT|nr:MAG: tRNA guanosine(34) transglycosylase Tgt [Candidatus Falkowbacteria bacterium RIFOXYC2_FULL_36_12]OGF33193.1 MAG: tRNA guanosine(34) transglycosylase Tgt [Candidatus Falkowbacteria bacterium RIFOXYA2_FULL_35_8]